MKTWFIIVALVMPLIFMGVISHKKSILSSSAGQGDHLSQLLEEVIKLNQKKEHQKAIDIILFAIERQKEGSLLRGLLVQTFDLLLQEELKVQEEAFLANPKNAKAYQRAANALNIMGERFSAFEVLVRGVRLNPNSTDLWMNIARLEIYSGRENEALDIFREVIRIDPKNADALNNASYILAKSKYQHKEALTYIGRALAIDPGNQDYLETLAHVEKQNFSISSLAKPMERSIKYLSYE